jgi:2,3-bisphosphoglycerate-dependent phosphoglycerate mutase
VKGIEEAHFGAQQLKKDGYTFDVAYTSVLSRFSFHLSSNSFRAIKTLWITLEDLNLMWIPVYKSWRLNERMYGGLQGLDKSQTAAKHGEEQVTEFHTL